MRQRLLSGLVGAIITVIVIELVLFILPDSPTNAEQECPEVDRLEAELIRLEDLLETKKRTSESL